MKTLCVEEGNDVGKGSCGAYGQTFSMNKAGCNGRISSWAVIVEPDLGRLRCFVEVLAWVIKVKGFCDGDEKSKTSLSKIKDARVRARGAHEKGAAFLSNKFMSWFVSWRCFLG